MVTMTNRPTEWPPALTPKSATLSMLLKSCRSEYWLVFRQAHRPVLELPYLRLPCRYVDEQVAPLASPLIILLSLWKVPPATLDWFMENVENSLQKGM